MAKVKYEGPENLVCDDLELYNQGAEAPAVPVNGEVYDISEPWSDEMVERMGASADHAARLRSFVASAYFFPQDAEAQDAYDNLVRRGIVVDPTRTREIARAEGAEDAPVELDATDGAVAEATHFGIDLTEVEIEGSGSEGRITKSDVEAFVEANGIEDPDQRPASDPGTGLPRLPETPVEDERPTDNDEGGEA
jgi:pyruvate/2-oxoglutarate dehydrogenase complex dihydrolipoamide acyltransferase (E2) component